VCFYFNDDKKARDAYDSIKAWTCKLGKIEKLYAFSYAPQGPEQDVQPSGWSIYDPMKEWRRMGVGEEGGNKTWRVTKINSDYGFSPTYPAMFPVPAGISDITLNYAGRYRSRTRIPALTYLHPVNNCSITRCSQPMVGVRGNRSIQDEKLLAAIFSTTRAERPLSTVGSPAPEREDSGSSRDIPPPSEDTQTNAEALEDAMIAKLRGDNKVDGTDKDWPEPDDSGPRIYGAQQRNMIVDARPTVNAYAMQAVGLGTENMENYKFATKVYLGIDNIHVMRDSLQKVIDALKDSDLTPLGPNKEALQKSHWLKHIGNLLDGVGLIARQVGLQHSHVLIHCSDGWDRTSQLSSLSQICLDPYYRTIEGFMILVEKDWLSFGHMFKHRSGFLSSEKWFHIENERVGGRGDDEPNQAKEALAGAQRSFENAFLSAKGFFTKQNNDSKDSLAIDSEAEIQTIESDTPKRAVSGTGKDDKTATKVKETAPIFHQFLDATYQLLHQHPTRFEFTERFLRRLLYHLYSCQYGTFLLDNERERKEAKLAERTRSVWDYFLARKKEFTNPSYESDVDDNVRGKERLIFPDSEHTRWWNEVFGRTDEEMNGNPPKIHVNGNGAGNGDGEGDSEMSSYGMATSAPVSRSRTPVLTGVETSEAAVGVGAPPRDELKDIKAEKIEAEKPLPEDPALDTVKSEPNLATSISPNTNANTTRNNSAPTPPEKDPVETAISPPTEHQIESAPQQVQIQEDTLADLPDGLDPLGIGDVKDHIPVAKRAQEKRKEQMAALLQ
jgi:myotubularin-related protein 6/7/8